MNFAGKIVTFVHLNMLYELNYADDLPYHWLYPPFVHQNSSEKDCITEFGPITRGQHRFSSAKCQILYCPPDPKVQDITEIDCKDYLNKTNLPENFPDTEIRIYFKICEFCAFSPPTTDLDLMDPYSTTPVSRETSTTQAPA